MKILFQDNRIIVCVKPAGVLSTDEPGGVPDLLRASLGESAPIRSVHRLDRVTGGVMVYALTKRCAAELSDQIRTRVFRKTYLAVVEGTPVPSDGVLRDYLQRNTEERKTVVVSDESPHSQLAELEYTVLEEKNGLSLLKIGLKTGRTHQIRCQMASREHPLFGDRKYGYGKEEEKLALWSYEISFVHPRTKSRMTFNAPPPVQYPWTLFPGSTSQT